MSESVAVIIGTFGDRATWNAMAIRAVQSACNQTRVPDEIIRHHRNSLLAVRQEAAKLATSRYLVFLDADDELEPNYIEAMLKGSGDVRWPRVRVLTDTPDEKISLPDPIEIEPKPSLWEGNHIVVGAMIRRDLFWRVGGFDDWEVCEDWALWLKCSIAAADMQLCRDAIYRQHWRPKSRNQMERTRYAQICDEIRRHYRKELQPA